MIPEEWRPIAGYPYEVSDRGRVRRSVASSQAKSGHIMRGFRDKDGYARVKLFPTEGGPKRDFKRATLVAEAFIGPRPPGLQVRHLDGDRSNDARGNLAWGTAKENSEDRIQHGTQARGETQGRACLTNAQAAEVRERYRQVKQGRTYAPIGWLDQAAMEYGIRKKALQLILLGRGYR